MGVGGGVSPLPLVQYRYGYGSPIGVAGSDQASGGAAPRQCASSAELRSLAAEIEQFAFACDALEPDLTKF